MNQLKKSDIYILHIINKAIRCKFLDWLMPKVTYLGSVQFSLLLFLTTLMVPNDYMNKFSKKVAVSLIISTLITWGIKLSIQRVRPFLKLENLNIKKIDIDKYSFPSAHSSAVLSMGIMATMFFPSLSFIFLTISILTAVSRVYIGVHYPLDILVGAIIGVLTSINVF
jgi:undecaprenyl-diphosphatase